MPRSCPSFACMLIVTAFAGACTSSQTQHKDQAKPDRSRGCTEMACSDGASIEAKLSAAGAPLGNHEFALSIEGKASTCTVEFVDVGQAVEASCTQPDVSLRFGPATKGVETRMGEVVGYTEEPIPGEFRWMLAVSGTPTTIHVVHTHAGTTILDQTAELTQYADHRPNGEGCEPVCKQASVVWQGP